MEVELLSRPKVLLELRKWVKFPVEEDELPGHTYGALENGELVAIAGLRLCEGPVCILDSMATNPECPSELRHQAIEALVDRILTEAKAFKYRGIRCETKDASIVQRAVARGFTVLPEISMVRAL